MPDARGEGRWSGRRVRAMWIGWWLLQFTAMHTPKPVGISQPFDYFDKCVHLGLYAVLAGLCCWSAFASRRRVDARWYVTWFVILAVYAGVDELSQPLVGRFCDFWDWVTDVVGIALGFGVARLLLRRGVDQSTEEGA